MSSRGTGKDLDKDNCGHKMKFSIQGKTCCNHDVAKKSSIQEHKH